MRKHAWRLLVIFLALGFSSSTRASSLLIGYFATVSSDVQVGPSLASTLPTNAVGAQLLIVEDFYSNPNPPVHADMLYSPFIAQATFFILSQGGPGMSPPAYTLQPYYAFYFPSPAGFTSSMMGATNFISGLGTLQLSQTGTNYSADLNVVGTGTNFSSRTLDFSVTFVDFKQVSPVPLPTALPMFASALMALGLFGVYARRGKRDSVEMAV
jgi:hypothetical protein